MHHLFFSLHILAAVLLWLNSALAVNDLVQQKPKHQLIRRKNLSFAFIAGTSLLGFVFALNHQSIMFVCAKLALYISFPAIITVMLHRATSTARSIESD